jgi:hypothetical protein
MSLSASVVQPAAAGPAPSPSLALRELDVRLDETNRDELKQLLETGELVKFDWKDKWLKGEEYLYMLANQARYAEALNIPIFELKMHPDSIYTAP